MGASTSHPLLIVPDTNVCVSGTTITTRAPSQIMQAWQAGRVDYALCKPLLAEIQDVLSRPYFRTEAGWTEKRVSDYIGQLREGSYIMPATTPVNVSPDPDDNVLFSCALEAGADYIVSYDKKDVLEVGEYRGVKPIYPTDFVREVLQATKAA